MLTAYTKSGKKLSLGYPFKKETLVSLRSREEFICPLCGERVFLKLGDQKIYHFAHQKGGSCREFFENETEYHMEGKLKLYRWLKRQKIPAELEYYDRKIRQRPDILFYANSKKYALEFQCSTISEQIFRERTEKYLENGYIPLWIIGGNSLDGDFVHKKGLNNFHYLFLRKTSNGQLFIPIFSPDKNILQEYFSIFPYSSKNTFLQKIIKPLDKVNLPFLLEPPIKSQLNPYQWKTASEKYLLNWSLYPRKQQRNFLHEIYNHHLNLFLLPPEIGVPLPLALLIRTPPFMWQTYYYLDILRERSQGEYISIAQLEKSFAKRMRNGEIMIRTIPQAGNLNPFSAYLDYTNFLVGQRIMTSKGNGMFQFSKEIEIPKSNREKEERNANFYQHYPFEK